VGVGACEGGPARLFFPPSGDVSFLFLCFLTERVLGFRFRGGILPGQRTVLFIFSFPPLLFDDLSPLRVSFSSFVGTHAFLMERGTLSPLRNTLPFRKKIPQAWPPSLASYRRRRQRDFPVPPHRGVRRGSSSPQCHLLPTRPDWLLSVWRYGVFTVSCLFFCLSRLVCFSFPHYVLEMDRCLPRMPCPFFVRVLPHLLSSLSNKIKDVTSPPPACPVHFQAEVCVMVLFYLREEIRRRL